MKSEWCTHRHPRCVRQTVSFLIRCPGRNISTSVSPLCTHVALFCAEETRQHRWRAVKGVHDATNLCEKTDDFAAISRRKRRRLAVDASQLPLLLVSSALNRFCQRQLHSFANLSSDRAGPDVGLEGGERRHRANEHDATRRVSHFCLGPSSQNFLLLPSLVLSPCTLTPRVITTHNRQREIGSLVNKFSHSLSLRVLFNSLVPSGPFSLLTIWFSLLLLGSNPVFRLPPHFHVRPSFCQVPRPTYVPASSRRTSCTRKNCDVCPLHVCCVLFNCSCNYTISFF